MADLEYRIGGLKIDPEKLSFAGSDSYKASHKFLAEVSDNLVSIYVAAGISHGSVALAFDLPEERLVGGGSFYLNPKDRLVLDNYSDSYDAIPKEAAQRFAELMLPKLQELGVEVKGIQASPAGDLHSFWKEKGFKPSAKAKPSTTTEDLDPFPMW